MPKNKFRKANRFNEKGEICIQCKRNFLEMGTRGRRGVAFGLCICGAKLFSIYPRGNYCRLRKRKRANGSSLVWRSGLELLTRLQLLSICFFKCNGDNFFRFWMKFNIHIDTKFFLILLEP